MRPKTPHLVNIVPSKGTFEGISTPDKARANGLINGTRGALVDFFQGRKDSNRAQQGPSGSRLITHTKGDTEGPVHIKTSLFINGAFTNVREQILSN
eukprot:660164-Alexandrium_andersonii.AAC.1